MKITNQQLKQIIKEELELVLKENEDIGNYAMALAIMLGTGYAAGGAYEAGVHKDKVERTAYDNFEVETGSGDLEEPNRTRPDLSEPLGYEKLKASIKKTADANPNMSESDVWLKVIHGAYDYADQDVKRKLKKLERDIEFDAGGKKVDRYLDSNNIKGLTYETKKRS